MKKKVKKEEFASAAILTIKGAARMSPLGKVKIAKWLRVNADKLISEGNLYSETTRIRYLYRKH